MKITIALNKDEAFVFDSIREMNETARRISNEMKRMKSDLTCVSTSEGYITIYNVGSSGAVGWYANNPVDVSQSFTPDYLLKLMDEVHYAERNLGTPYVERIRFVLHTLGLLNSHISPYAPPAKPSDGSASTYTQLSTS